MKNYVGTEFIEAREMTKREYNDRKGWRLSGKSAEGEGYFVKYSDGHESWSPKDVFEDAYKECNGMTFGIAVELLKKGFKVAREGWNGKEMFLYHVPAASYAPCTEIGRECATDDGKVPYGAYIAMKTAQGNVVPWLSQTDVLAEDWVIVE